MKKYELTEETVTVYGKTLYRIRAVRDFGSVKTGEFGGYIEKEENLSHFGNAWVSGNAWVFDNARVYDNAWVFGNAWVFDNARVYDDTWVYGNARVYDDAWVCGDAKVYGDAWVSGNAEVFNTRHFFVQGPIGSRNGFITFYRTKDNTVEVRCGCFSGSLQKFVDRVEETHGGSRYEKEYKLAAELAKVCIRLEGESR
jgi:hypothetical protein|nr:MAG TPA: Putative transferase, nesg, ydcK, Structural Genomics.38A [Caudoviricetes sp.]